MSDLVTSIDESLWICEQEPLDPCVAGAKLIRRYENVDATYADGILTSVKSVTSYTDPKADNQTYTGTWYNSVTTGHQSDADERYIVIVQTLTKVADITAYTDLPAKITRYGKDVMDPFAVITSSTHASVREDFVFHEWLYLNPAHVAVINGLDLSSFLPTNHIEIKRRVDIEELGDRTCSLRVWYTKMTYSNTVDSDKDPVIYKKQGERGVQGVHIPEDIRTFVAPGLDVTNIEGIIDRLKTTPIDGASGTVVLGVDATLGSNGDITVHQQQQVINTYVGNTVVVSSSDGSLLLDVAKNKDGLYTTLTRYWPSITVAAAASLVGLGTSPTSYAIGNASYDSETFYHRRATIQYDRTSGLCTVVQDCDTGNTNTDSMYWWLRQGHTESYEHHIATINKAEWNVLTQQLLTSSASLARDFVNCSGAYTISAPWQKECPEPDQEHLRGTIQYREDTIYDAKRVLFYRSSTFQTPPTIT